MAIARYPYSIIKYQCRTYRYARRLMFIWFLISSRKYLLTPSLYCAFLLGLLVFAVP